MQRFKLTLVALKIKHITCVNIWLATPPFRQSISSCPCIQNSLSLPEMWTTCNTVFTDAITIAWNLLETTWQQIWNFENVFSLTFHAAFLRTRPMRLEVQTRSTKSPVAHFTKSASYILSYIKAANIPHLTILICLHYLQWSVVSLRKRWDCNYEILWELCNYKIFAFDVMHEIMLWHAWNQFDCTNLICTKSTEIIVIGRYVTKTDCIGRLLKF